MTIVLASYLYFAEVCWVYIYNVFTCTCVSEDLGTQLFAFICMCKCSVNFSKFDIYTCKFSAVKERGGKKGGGGGHW